MGNRLKGRKFGRRTAHRNAMLCNLVKAIVTHRRITTTLAKAKDIRSCVEKLVTIARRGDLHSRRLVISRLRNDEAVAKVLLEEIAPLYIDRPGGYLRIMKKGFRTGDAAPMAILEFVGYDPDTRKLKGSVGSAG